MAILQEYMMQEFVEKTTVADAKRELLNFTVDVLKEEGVISDESVNRWRNIDIRTASVFDGISDIYSWWQYGLDWTPNIKWTKNNDLKLHLTSPFALSSLQ